MIVRSFRVVPLLMATVLLGQAGAAAAPGPAQRLIDAYTPITMLREEQDPPCETSAEQYEPTSVSTVLGNPSVELKRIEEDCEEEVVKRAPTAADIAGLGDPFHLELPGDPLGDTCVYARDFARLMREGKAPPTTYAHIARQVGRPGLVVQYWFFWYFNQFNDLHEGDWEGMQIAFEANTPHQAPPVCLGRPQPLRAEYHRFETFRLRPMVQTPAPPSGAS